MSQELLTERAGPRPLPTLQRVLVMTGCLGLVALVGLLESASDSELAFSVFYLVPICLATVAIGAWAGYAFSAVSSLGWALAELTGPAVTYSHVVVPYWNTLSRFVMFAAVTYLLASSRSALAHAHELARVDHLTAIPNVRHFYEAGELEIKRARRSDQPISVAYLDIDNFKSVNDLLGHSVGDRLLQLVGRVLRNRVRSTDVVARLGGDEFGMLLPDTSAEGARQLIHDLRNTLLEEVRIERLPVTFSIGVITFAEPPRTVDEMVARADHLMYQVKGTGKDDVAFETRIGSGVG